MKGRHDYPKVLWTATVYAVGSGWLIELDVIFLPCRPIMSSQVLIFIVVPGDYIVINQYKSQIKKCFIVS